jgi:large subunit ribosomal protein L17
MRHGHKINHLGRKAPHRKAMLANMASSLILHKRINTTLAKAKELRKYVEPLITKAKNDTTHSRRVVFSYLQDKYSVKELFNDVAEQVATRPGGYTRILKTGNRLGDNAEMCIIELVDYNELLLQAEDTGKSKTRRSRRSKKGGTYSKPKSEQSADETKKSTAQEDKSGAEEVKEEESASESKVEAKTDEAKEEKKDSEQSPVDEKKEDEDKESK